MKKIKQILILGNFGPGAMEHQFVKGFKACDVEVLYFEIQQPIHAIRQKSLGAKIALRLIPDFFRQDLNRNVLAYVKAHRPEVIFILKGMDLFPETIKEIKSYTNLLCNYNPDHPFLFFSSGAGNAHIKNSIQYYDLFFSYASSIVAQLKSQYNLQAFQVPFGFDQDLKARPNTPPGISDKAVFIGAWDKQRAQFFNHFTPESIAIFGPPSWASRNARHSNVYKSYQGKALYDQDYVDANANALGSINLLRPQNMVESSHNMRTFEVPGCGGLLISQRTEEQQGFFTEGEEALYFSSIDELQDILKNLTPERAQCIKVKAKERAERSGYSYYDRSVTILNLMNTHY